MKKGIVLAAVLLALISSMFAAGPIADKIYFNVKMQQEIGLKDAAEGLTDFFNQSIQSSVINSMDKATRDKLSLYTVPSGSWSLLINPYPNAAPYIVKGKDILNPFAIKKVRFALNNLINRKYLVDEIIGGAGGPQFNVATPGWPSSYKYELQATKMGFTAEGNEKKAIADIDAAMKEAANLSELKGKLVKNGAFWEYNGKPVSIKFLIRVDDPNGRLRSGRYIASQIEKAGIKVERLEYDRTKCVSFAYDSNPSEYEWTMYTEAWGAGQYYTNWDQNLAQMYAPYYGNMPGGQVEGYWQYENSKLDKLIIDINNGNVLTEKEYWEKALDSAKIGVEEAVRIYLTYQNEYYATNKARFSGKMLYDIGAGPNGWSLATAKTKDKTVKVTLFSAQGSLFMFPWDPIGLDGFSDTYARSVAENTYIQSITYSPNNGQMVEMTAKCLNTDTKVARNAKGELEGQISVPANAVKYDSKTNKWTSVGNGVKSFTKSTYKLSPLKWHHGRPGSIADFLYAMGFNVEWSYEDGKGDKEYDAAFASQTEPGLKILKGYVIDVKNSTITNYYDFNYPADKSQVIANGAPSDKMKAGIPVGNTWEIYEALSRMVQNGGVSGTKWSFSQAEGVEEVDVAAPKCVKDIKAELAKMKAEKFVPQQLNGYVKAEEAAKYYQMAIDFIDKHGHALIGNGMYVLNKIDTKTNFVELIANRDIPFSGEAWAKQFKAKLTRIDKIDVPQMAEKSKDLKIKVKVSEISYPDDTSKLMADGTVKVMLITSKGEKEFAAKKVGNGLYEAIISKAELAKLPAGSCTVMINATVKGGTGVAGSQTTVIY